jgi:Protein tyrosine and serine/threonine kinase
VIVIVAVLVCLMVIAVVAFFLRRRSRDDGAATPAKSRSAEASFSEAEQHYGSLTADTEQHYGSLTLTTSVPDSADGGGTYAKFDRSLLQRAAAISREAGSQGGVVTLDPASLVVGEMIGKGNFGEVFRGMYLKETVAIKHMVGEATGEISPDALAEFIAEASLMASVGPHENVLKFLGVVSLAGSQAPAIVTEFCAGSSLEDQLLRRELSLTEAWKVVQGIACGMAHLVRFNVVHRVRSCYFVCLSGQFSANCWMF